MTIPAMIAVQKFFTCKEVYNLLTKNTVKPLMTTMKSPNVNKIAGSESSTTIGFITALINAKINPATIIPRAPSSY
jgi:hypothetical protein